MCLQSVSPMISTEVTDTTKKCECASVGMNETVGSQREALCMHYIVSKELPGHGISVYLIGTDFAVLRTNSNTILLLLFFLILVYIPIAFFLLSHEFG